MTECPYGLQGLSYEWALEKARRFNLTIELADERTLQMDLDSQESINTFWSQYDLMLELGLLEVVGNPVERKSKSGVHWHITVTLKNPMPVEERILFQALLGSDVKREALSIKRVKAGMVHPVLLFRPSTEEQVIAELDDLLPF